ncbi:MAG: OmpA family protein [Lewinellaceae bacterium]|nr:OmpA family protein [Lewinellaceae bacterium]
MNSKSLVLIVFVLWSVLCWRWYVCGLMNACGDDPKGLSSEEVVAVPDDRIDTSVTMETPEIKPLNDNKTSNIKAPGSNPPTNYKPSKPVSPSNMDEVQMEEVEDRMVIHFPYKSTRKEDNAAIDAYLSNLASQLIASGEKVSITGHADFVGEPGDNYTFALRRANGIRDILVKKGVPKSQIRCKSFGDRKPAATNDTPYGRYLNRRVEIRVE